MRTLYTGADVFDGTGAPPATADVVVENGRILDVGPGLDGDAAVDLTGATLLPGLIDCHVHVTVDGIDTLKRLAAPYSLRYFQTARNLGALLDAGLTTVRDAGGADLGVKAAVDGGVVRGPRLRIAITMLSQTGGHADPWLPSGACTPALPATPGVPPPVVDGVDEMRRRVRELVRAGADWIKVAASGGVMSPGTDPRRAQFTPDELRTAVAEAAAAGLGVMAHAQAGPGIRNAITAGARSIEHGVYLDDDLIALMRERGTVLVPTLLAPRSVLDAAASGAAFSERSRAKVAEIMEAHDDSFRRAVAAGVPVAMGTDAIGYPHGRNLEELELMRAGGMSPLQALHTATGAAAALLGLADDLGTIAPGRRADLVAVRGAATDLTGLRERILLVVKDGRFAAGLSTSEERRSA
ncbi:amidohydrolase family protein [Spongiactinospora gelatinilytica]|uniref:Amidohydrolase family protein n=1 Tax=Spongiactinospora gelatinilytica TaxID=2666298 RepID=A0A2W2FZC4_9ACTN|nr:amidohydrolase family protein [Spongiactinospora gelatinilytica]PZG41053.1 amidohydrolase family protein [Spongiactinospora gelatinilytica]